MGQRQYSVGLQERVMERLRMGEAVMVLSREFNITPQVVYRWRDRMRGRPGKKVGESAEQKRDQEIQALESRIAELEGVIGRKGMEVDFLASALRRVGGEAPLSENSGEKTSGPRSATGWNRKAR